MSALKKAFYPTEEVFSVLEAIPRGQLSQRLNELILKALEYEKQEKIASDYHLFNQTIAQDQAREQNSLGFSNNMMMASNAFKDEDDVEDFI